MPATSYPLPRTDGAFSFPGLSERRATQIAFGLLLFGLLCRTVRYLLQFPVWGDEALLAINFVRLDYAQLAQRLDNCQVAPLLFLWGERTALCLFGSGELSLRFLPFLASVSALVLYWRLTGLLLNAHARLFAIGFLAVAYFAVTLSTAIKPYSFDLMMALVLLVPAVHWLKTPSQTRWLIALTLVVPIALLGSYPAVFVAGGVSLALCRRVWQEGWQSRCWFVAYHVTLLAGFVAGYFIGINQLHTSTGGTSTETGMASYWAQSFPPATPWAWPVWFARLTTGQMTAYPVGSADGGSSLTVLFCLIGVRWWARRRQWAYLILLSAPLFLNLVAAVLHRYPYGGAARLSQHLAPGLCILAGLGLAALLTRVNSASAPRVRWAMAAVALFVCAGLGGLGRDLVRPYYSPGCAWMRTTMKEMQEQVPAADRVVVCGQSDQLECVFVWYWLNEGKRVSWNYEIPPTNLAGHVWGFHQGAGADAACQRLAAELGRRDSAWHLVKRMPYTYEPRSRKEMPQACELFCFARG